MISSKSSPECLNSLFKISLPVKIAFSVSFFRKKALILETAKCCSSLPGDAIKGYVSTGRGIIVHKADCPNITRLEENKDRIVDVEWDNSDKLSMPCQKSLFRQ